MRRVPTLAAVGERLALDVRDGRPGGMPLLRSGATVTRTYAERLQAAGVTTVFVDDRLGDGIEIVPALEAATRAAAETAVDRAFREVLASSRPRPLHDRTLREIQAVANEMVAEIADADPSGISLLSLAAADAYALQHAIDVTVLGVMLARRLFTDEGRVGGRQLTHPSEVQASLVRLGVGLLLADIGKFSLPPELLAKSGPLDEQEWESIREHTTRGDDLMAHDRMSYHARSVIRHHHERWDGDGYPDRLAGERIPPFARIAGVADAYAAMTSERPYRRSVAPADAHATVTAGEGTLYDPAIVRVFRLVVPPYPLGQDVVLDDGRRAIVAHLPPDRLDRPVVRVYTDPEQRPTDPADLALVDHPGLGIVTPGSAAE